MEEPLEFNADTEMIFHFKMVYFRYVTKSIRISCLDSLERLIWNGSLKNNAKTSFKNSSVVLRGLRNGSFVDKIIYYIDFLDVGEVKHKLN